MGTFDGLLHLRGDDEPPVNVEIDLSDERLVVKAGDVEVADWALDRIRINALSDGFHVRAEGEEVILEVDDDGRFAVDIGLRSAPPTLRRKMSALLRDDPEPVR